MNESTSNAAAAPKTGGASQFRLITLLLAITTAATWFAWWRTQHDVRLMEHELPELRTAARELIVSDKSQFAVVKKPTSWLKEQTWEVHVPAGDTFSLNLKFQNLSENEFTEPLKSVPIPAGVHEIQFLREKKDKDVGQIEVRLDGKTVFNEEHAIGRTSIRTFHHAMTTTRTWPKEEPVLLYHIQYGFDPNEENETWDGILVWIGSATE